MNLSFNRKPPEVPQPEGADYKEVYAFFGLCAFYAQVLEQGLINLTVALHIRGLTQITPEDVFQSFDRMERKTFGQLISDVRKKIDVPGEIEEALSMALEDRNYLMHRFFPKHHIDFGSNPGRHEMIDELRTLTLRFQTTDRQVETTTLRLWNRLGITQTMLESELSKMQAEAERCDPRRYEFDILG
jgi:hypothetical protein